MEQDERAMGQEEDTLFLLGLMTVIVARRRFIFSSTMFARVFVILLSMYAFASEVPADLPHAALPNRPIAKATARLSESQDNSAAMALQNSTPGALSAPAAFSSSTGPASDNSARSAEKIDARTVSCAICFEQIHGELRRTRTAA